MPPNANNAPEFIQNTSSCRWVFLGLVLITPAITPGMTGPFSGIALPQMKLDLDEASWFGSIISISCPFGSLVTGIIIDKYGRRTSLLSGIVPNIVGWFMLADKNASLSQLYLGRLLTGFALGMSGLPSVIYAAECITVNDDRIRTSVGTWTSVSMAFGSFLVFGFGALLPYNEVALLSGCLSTLSLILIVAFIPESPAWLHRQGRIGDAEAAQLRLRIKQPILYNAKILPFAAHLVNRPPAPDRYSLKSALHYLSKIRRREVYKPLAITVGFLFFAQFSGIYCLSSYMIDVITVYPFEESAYALSAVSGLVQIIGGVLLTFALPRTGVQASSVFSFLGVSMCFCVLAFSVLCENAHSAPNVFNYLHVLAVWLIELLGNMGVVCIPYSILGETFPMGAKGFASLSLFAAAVFNFTVLKLFPYVFAEHRNVVFFVFSFICACGAVFVARCLPETVGKTVDEIKNGFKPPMAGEYVRLR